MVKIRLVPCADWEAGHHWNAPKRLMVDGIHRGWVQYRRTSEFASPFSGGHYLLSHLPKDFHSAGSKSTSTDHFKVTNSWSLQRVLEAVPGEIERGLLPTVEEVPARLAQADVDVRKRRRAARHRDLFREVRTKRRDARFAEISRDAEARRAEDARRLTEAVEALMSIRDRRAEHLSNFEMDGVHEAIRRLAR